MKKAKQKGMEIFLTKDGKFLLIDEKTKKEDWLIRESEIIKVMNKVVRKHLKRAEHRLKGLKGAKNPSEDWIDTTENDIRVFKEIIKENKNG